MPFSQDPGTYAPELVELMKKGAMQRVEIKCPSHGRAVHMRHKLYAMRRAYASVNHVLTPTLLQCELQIHTEQDGQVLLIAQPANFDIREQLKEQGIEVMPVVDSDSDTPALDQTLEDFLKKHETKDEKE